MDRKFLTKTAIILPDRSCGPVRLTAVLGCAAMVLARQIKKELDDAPMPFVRGTSKDSGEFSAIGIACSDKEGLLLSVSDITI